MNGGGQASTLSTLPTYRELDIVEEYFLLSRPAIGLLLQTKPRAEKEAGGTFLGCFIGWWQLSREVPTCSGMTGERAREEPMLVDHPACRPVDVGRHPIGRVGGKIIRGVI